MSKVLAYASLAILAMIALWFCLNGKQARLQTLEVSPNAKTKPPNVVTGVLFCIHSPAKDPRLGFRNPARDFGWGSAWEGYGLCTGLKGDQSQNNCVAVD